MEVIGDYDTNGFALVRGLIPKAVARAFMASIKEDLGPAPIRLSHASKHPSILRRAAYQVHSSAYKPMSFFLWALTPTVGRLIGREVLPTYDYFRIYREGDICRIHSDRPACEHSLSLTLDYSDGEPWPLEIGRYSVDSYHPIQDRWDRDRCSILMEIGDAVLYHGVRYPHGRTTPNPNGWSAHLFLHYVDCNGPHAGEAFDRKAKLDPVNFAFA
jgi:hypothetical protein